MSVNPTRRELLHYGARGSAYAATAMVGGAALVGEARGAAAGVSPGLAKLLAEFRRADGALDRFYDTTFNPAIVREHALHAATPHVEREIPMLGGRIDTWSTARPLDVAQAKGIVSIPRRTQSARPEWRAKLKEARSFYSAHLRRERTLKRGHITTGAAAAAAREHEMCAPVDAASRAIRAFPVASIADMAAKLDHLHFMGARDGEADELFDAVRADVASLAGEA